MALLRGDEYIVAIQNPKTAFSDLDLRASTSEPDQFGIPKPYSGGFTTTFHLVNRSQEWAVRCFTRAVADLQERYAAISRFLSSHSNSTFVATAYLAQGIRVSAQWHPIIKMEWVRGETLNSFIDKNIGNHGNIGVLIPKFRDLIRTLQQFGIAHGDLQHGNVLVMNGQLYLIDYDGMFLPELWRLHTNELGHVNYQHPGRGPSHYGPYLDRFASIVIYLALLAIVEKPSLWNKYNNSENILFRATDFVDVVNSPLLRDMSAVQKLSPLVERFQGVCKLDFPAVPDLEVFIAGNFAYPKVTIPSAVAPSPIPTIPTRSQYVILDAVDSASLLRYVGQRVEVIGLISDYHADRTRYGRPYLFLNFGTYPNQTLTLALWSPSLKAFRRANTLPESLVGRWVKVSGVLGSYRSRPQMEVEMPSQVQLLSGKVEASRWLRVGLFPAASTPASRPAATIPSRKPTSDSPDDILNELYANRPAQTAPSQTQTSSVRSPTSAQAQAPNVTAGIVAALVLGVTAWLLWGFWGLILGAFVGYQIGKRLK